MIDNFIFENHLGQRFIGLENGTFINYNDLRDYSWEYETINNRISRFYRGITDRKLPLIVACKTEKDAISVKNRLMELSESDIEAKEAGKVFVGDYYTRGFITSSEKSNYLMSKKICKINLTLTSDDPAWYKEKLYIFRSDENETIGGGNGTDYPYDYSYDYAFSAMGRTIMCDSVGQSAIKILIYGAITNPSITIGEHTYAVDCTVEKGETLLIDGVSKTITLTTKAGKKVNCFDKRNRDSYIFETISSGQNMVTWGGGFSFDLTVVEKRSEPKWT